MINIKRADALQVGDVFSTDGYAVESACQLADGRVSVSAWLDASGGITKHAVLAPDFQCPIWTPDPMTRDEIIRAVQDYCADLHENGKTWTSTDGEHIAGLVNQDADPISLFRFIDEKPGDWRVGYKTKDGRDWFHILRQMRNKPGSGLLENLRR